MATSKRQYPHRAPRPGDPLAARTLRTIQRYDMLAQGDKVLVAVSGGPDSVALLHLLHKLAPRYDLRLGTAHLDHGLRPRDAEKELALVRSLARQLHLNCHAGKISQRPVQGSLEEQLREIRYEFLKRTAADHGYTKIALGHHADDNAEAVLLRLLRGSGIRGLAGIPPVRDGVIIRPLIHARRRDIMAYLAHHRLAFAEDPSNADPRFERNRVRHHLIPLLSEHYNPNVVATLNRLALLCREEEQWFSSHLHPHLAQIVRTCEETCLELASDPLAALPRPLQRRLVRSCLEKWQGHLRRLDAGHIEAVLDLATGRAGRCLSLPGAIQGRRTATGVLFAGDVDPRSPVAKGACPPYCYTVSKTQVPFALEIPEARCRLAFTQTGAIDPRQAVTDAGMSILLDMDLLDFPLTIRNRRPGDRLRPFGMAGTRKVKSLLIDRKIPAHRRDQIPLLMAGDAILWVAGVRRGSAAPISMGTRQALRVVLEPF